MTAKGVACGVEQYPRSTLGMKSSYSSSSNWGYRRFSSCSTIGGIAGLGLPGESHFRCGRSTDADRTSRAAVISVSLFGTSVEYSIETKVRSHPGPCLYSIEADFRPFRRTSGSLLNGGHDAWGSAFPVFAPSSVSALFVLIQREQSKPITIRDARIRQTNLLMPSAPGTTARTRRCGRRCRSPPRASPGAGARRAP